MHPAWGVTVDSCKGVASLVAAGSEAGFSLEGTDLVPGTRSAASELASGLLLVPIRKENEKGLH